MNDLSKIPRLIVKSSLGGDDINYFLPNNEDDVIALVNDARANKEVICVRGAAHSFPLINTLEQNLGRKNYKYLMLSNMNKVVITGNTVKVDAGCHLGEDPFDPAGLASLQRSLTKKLFDAGWAIGDLGGISHQTVGGFLSTASSGGSTTYAFEDALMSIDLIICGANGAEKVTYSRPADNNGDDPFFAVGLASLGVMGVIVSATFQCIKTFNIDGTEIASSYDDCEINLFGPAIAATPTQPAKPSFQQFLEKTEYTRLIWWPQTGVSKIVVWQAKRRPKPLKGSDDFTRVPYQEVPWVLGSPIPLTVGADLLYTAMGRWPNWLGDLIGTNNPEYDEIVGWVEKYFKTLIFPTICSVFVGGKEKKFSDYWYTGLPMDNQMSDKLLPIWFTEFWIPIDKTEQVMKKMKEYYEGEKGCERTGIFSVELYAAKASSFWFSPAFETNVVRIDIFWFANSNGDPVKYYQQFWDLLKPFEFRPHWAKYFPDPTQIYDDGSTPWRGYLKSVYKKKWEDWKNLRDQNDPERIFLNDYWAERLELKP